VSSRFVLQEGERAVFVLGRIEPDSDCRVLLSEAEAHDLASETVEFWRRWLSRCTYRGFRGRWSTGRR
jgi:hypothetical protein